MKTKQINIIPFSNGSEADVWQSHNCFRCTKYESKSTTVEEAKCDLAFYLDLARGTGPIPLNIAQRIGYCDEKNGFVKLCNRCKNKTGKTTPEQRERYNLHRRAKRAGFNRLDARKRTFFTANPIHKELPEAVKILMNKYKYVIQTLIV